MSVCRSSFHFLPTEPLGCPWQTLKVLHFKSLLSGLFINEIFIHKLLALDKLNYYSTSEGIRGSHIFSSWIKNFTGYFEFIFFNNSNFSLFLDFYGVSKQTKTHKKRKKIILSIFLKVQISFELLKEPFIKI